MIWAHEPVWFIVNQVKTGLSFIPIWFGLVLNRFLAYRFFSIWSVGFSLQTSLFFLFLMFGGCLGNGRHKNNNTKKQTGFNF